jgi:type VI secretion system secreted protein VgrG
MLQATRHIEIDTPLGEDVLLLRRFSGREEISGLFEFDLDLLSDNHEIDFNEIIGQNVTVSMDQKEGGKRYWNGYISRFVQGVSTSTKFAQYRATMVPWLWFLTRTSDCRIFQDKNVPEIIKQVFNDLGFSDIEDRLSGSYQNLIYCVQYRETDFAFVSRLMEKEGIYYYFKHKKGRCTIVLCDSRSNHDPYGGYEQIDFAPDTDSSVIPERIHAWTVDKQVRSGKFAHTDYNFTKPSTSLMSAEADPKGHAQADYEIYEYPGRYPEKADGDNYAKVRMQALARPHEICTGESDARGICTGHLFTLAKHPRGDQNRECLVVSTHYQASAGGYETAVEPEESCACSFTAIPGTVQFRTARTTPKPTIHGTQTAVVTGPSGEEIHTDEHGRVKVQFHWDREGQFDENSSCWIRVSQQWAGAGWGAMFIPHIGQEVIVDFEEGDPDRPIITGRVYNGNNKPADALPDEKTKSVLRSRNDNDIVIEDKEGEKFIQIKQANGNEIYLHEETPDIEIKQECGNKIHMKASGPDIEITQACGNQILMREAEGVQMRDKYGNEIVLDSEAGFIRIASPSHNSVFEVGKSVSWRSDSNQESLIAADTKTTVLGYTQELFMGLKTSQTVGLQSEIFVGGKHETLLGAKIGLNAAKEYTFNALNRTREGKGDLTYKAKDQLTMSGGEGTSEVVLNKKQAYMHSKHNFVRIEPNGNLEINNTHGNGILTIKSNNKIVIDTPQEIHIKGSKVLAKKGEFRTKHIKSSK